MIRDTGNHQDSVERFLRDSSEQITGIDSEFDQFLSIFIFNEWNEFTRSYGRRSRQWHPPHFRLRKFFGDVTRFDRVARWRTGVWCLWCLGCRWNDWYRLRWRPRLDSCTPTAAADGCVIIRLTIAHFRFLETGELKKKQLKSPADADR